MSWKRSTLFLFLLVFAGAMSLATTAGAITSPCSVLTVNTVVPPDAPGAPPAPAGSGNHGVGLYPNNGSGTVIPTLNQEGEAERPADLLLYDNGTGTCFPAGEQIIITYNAALTHAGSGGATVANDGSDLDVMDSAGTSGLVINVTTSVGLSTFNTPQTVITISILQAGTSGDLLTGYTGSAVRLKNLRFNVTSLVGVTSHLQATISTSNPVTALLGADTLSNGSDLETVGSIAQTVGLSELESGFGFQSSPPGLCDASEVEFGDDFGGAFRTAITSQAVYRDIATGDTSLIFNVTNIPSGVTVTFPSSLANSGSFGGNLTFNARSSTLTATGGNLSVIYDTTVDSSSVADLEAATDNTASTVNSTNFCLDEDCVGPKIGVAIGSATGYGTASIEAVFGPTDGPAAFTGDDVNASAIPLYIKSTGPSAPSRRIVDGNFFTIDPVETVLLYPYVSDKFGFETGFEVANTGNSSTIFPFTGSGCLAPATNGSITFYFFPNGAAPFSYTVPAGVGRGLDATTGNLDSGNIFADTLGDLLTKSGNSSMVGNFDGYVMVVTQFFYAHGIGLVLSASNGNSVMSSDALVLGPIEGLVRRGLVQIVNGRPESLGAVTTRKH